MHTSTGLKKGRPFQPLHRLIVLHFIALHCLIDGWWQGKAEKKHERHLRGKMPAGTRIEPS